VAIGIGIAAFLGMSALTEHDNKKKRDREAAERLQREKEREVARTARRAAVATIERARRDADVAAKQRDVRGFAEKTLSALCLLFNIPRRPLHVGEEVENFASDGSRILGNPRWALEVLEKHCPHAACNRDVLRWFIAHEVGHHMNGDAFTPPWIGAEKVQNHVQELRADYIAGFALAYLNGDVEFLDSVLREHASIENDTHPNFIKRMRAAREGFFAAQFEAQA